MAARAQAKITRSQKLAAEAAILAAQSGDRLLGVKLAKEWAEIIVSMDVYAVQIASQLAQAREGASDVDAPLVAFVLAAAAMMAMQQEYAAHAVPWADSASNRISEHRREVMRDAYRETLSELEEATGVTKTVTDDEIDALVEQLNRERPIRPYIVRYVVEGGQKLQRNLEHTISRKHNGQLTEHEAVSKAVQRSLAPVASKAYTVQATETTRGRRMVSLAVAASKEYAGKVIGWRWYARLDACPFCAEQHGSFHKLSEGMNSHPNCRCEMVWVTRLGRFKRLKSIDRRVRDLQREIDDDEDLI